MSATEFKDLGNKAFQQQLYHEAIEHYSNAIALEDNHVFYSNRSGAYLALNKFQEALEDADKCIEIQPTFAKGFGRRGAVLSQIGQLKDAFMAYQQASQLDPANGSYKDEMMSIQRKMQQQQQQQAPRNPQADMLNPFGPDMIQRLEANPQTKALISNPSVKAALQDISTNPQSISQHASNPAVMACLQALLGITPEMQQQAAQQEFEQEQKRKQAEEDRITRPYATPSMARDTTPVNDLNKAEPVEEEEEVIDEELEKEKRERKEKREQADKVKEEGATFYKARDFDNAIIKFKAAIEIDDTNPVYLMNIAACLYEQQKYQECIDTCKDALQVSPITPQQKSKIYIRTAHAYSKLKQYEECIQMYKKAILEDNAQAARQGLRQAEADFKQWKIDSYLDDGKSEEARELGNKAYSESNYGKAIEYYTEALKRNPNNYKVYSNRALCYIKVCEWEKGLNDCDKCLSFDPKFTKALLRKGKILHFLKSYHKALECYSTAAEIEPDNQELHEAIAATQRAIYSDNSPAGNEARLAEAMKDPEIQLAMSSPQVQKLLQDMQTDPQVALKAFEDPQTSRLLNKLVAAGIIKLG